MDWSTEIRAAAERIKGHVVKTPVMNSSAFGLPYSVELKFEQMQHTLSLIHI